MSVTYNIAAATPPPETPCCDLLTISSTGGTAEHQPGLLGDYRLDGKHNGRPLYKQEDGAKVLYYSGYRWVVGSSLNSRGLRARPGLGSNCPNEAAEWNYNTLYAWLVDSTAGLKCNGDLGKRGTTTREGKGRHRG